MKTIKQGSSGIDVLFLQASLGLTLDGEFGPKTDKAVKEFQSSQGLLSDGVVGPKSWERLLRDRSTLTEGDIREVAEELGIEPECLMAIKKVESAKSPFLPSGYPTVLFEAHLFYKYLKEIGKKNPILLQKTHPGILSKTWNKSLYKGGEKEISRLSEAWTLSPEASLYSASYGAFQICGFNWKVSGCSGVWEFVGKMWLGEKEQLALVGEFLKGTGMTKYLRSHDWSGFARAYNGPGYAENAYDIKLKRAYLSFKSQK